MKVLTFFVIFLHHRQTNHFRKTWWKSNKNIWVKVQIFQSPSRRRDQKEKVLRNDKNRAQTERKTVLNVGLDDITCDQSAPGLLSRRPEVTSCWHIYRFKDVTEIKWEPSDLNRGVCHRRTHFDSEGSFWPEIFTMVLSCWGSRENGWWGTEEDAGIRWAGGRLDQQGADWGGSNHSMASK